MMLVSWILEWYNYLLYIVGFLLRLFSILILCAIIRAEVNNHFQQEVYNYLDPFGFLVSEIKDNLYNEYSFFFFVSLYDSAFYTHDLRPYYRLNTYDYVFYNRGSNFFEDEGGYLKFPLNMLFSNSSKLIFFYDYFNRNPLEELSRAAYILMIHRIFAYQNWYQGLLGVDHYCSRTTPINLDTNLLYGPRIRKSSFYRKSFFNINFFSYNKPRIGSLIFRKESSKANFFFNIFALESDLRVRK